MMALIISAIAIGLLPAAASAAGHEAGKGYPVGYCQTTTANGTYQEHAWILPPFARASDGSHQIRWWARMVNVDYLNNVTPLTNYVEGTSFYLPGDGQWHQTTPGQALTYLQLDEPPAHTATGAQIWVAFYDLSGNGQDYQVLTPGWANADYFKYIPSGIILRGC